LAGILALAVLAVFGQAATFDFVNLDDPQYITLHKHVSGGPTLENLLWGLTTLDHANWHPLTWWSWQLDTAIWGAGPRGYHLTNIGLHLLNTLLVQRVLRQLTGRRLGTFFVTIVFAIHPLRWESVAWISERKDLLSALFALLAVERYHAYVRSPGCPRMAVVSVCLALSLMAKGMAVTLPCVLLFLDWRPYRRWTSPRAGLSLVLEKWPLWGLAMAACIITVIAQRSGGAVRDLAELSLGQRLAGATWAYAVYVGQTLWPANLSVFYPIPMPHPLWQPLLAGTMLCLLSWGAIAARCRWPAVTTGWFLFLGTLVPVIGLVQVGGQAHADRYTYLSSIPLLAALGILVFAATERLSGGTRWALAAAVIFPLAATSFLHGGTWRNSRALWQQACRAAPCDFNGWNLGTLELKEGRYEPAVTAFREACRSAPQAAEMRGGLAAALDGAEQWPEAEQTAREALALATPELVETQARCHLILGKAAARRGARDEAIREFEEGLRFSESLSLRSELAVRMMRSGGAREAVPHLRKICAEDPASASVHGNLANAFAELGDWPSTAAEFGAAVELAPNDPRMRSRWVTALLASGEADSARREARALAALDPKWPAASLSAAARMVFDPKSTRSRQEEGYWLASALSFVFEPVRAEVLDVMAGGAAALGRFDEAARLAEQGAAAARANGQADLAEAIEARRDAYRSGQRPAGP